MHRTRACLFWPGTPCLAAVTLWVGVFFWTQGLHLTELPEDASLLTSENSAQGWPWERHPGQWLTWAAGSRMCRRPLARGHFLLLRSVTEGGWPHVLATGTLSSETVPLY